MRLKAFSAIELLIIICIMGILSIGALRFISTGSEKMCLEKLRTQLFIAQEKIAMAYLRDFLLPQGIGALKAQMILNELGMSNNKACGFVYNVNTNVLMALVGNERITFNIDRLDKNPRIYCDFSQKSSTKDSCKKFYHRIYDK